MEMTKGISHCTCLPVILTHSVFKIGKNYCRQVLLEGFKYIAKEKSISKYINNHSKSLEITRNHVNHINK